MNHTNKKPYQGECILLTTMHHKSVAVAEPFAKILGASVLEHVVDTDSLGTFSGEIARPGSVLETVQQKCEWPLNQTHAPYGLASEGSFGPHPAIPFAPANQETLYFIDKRRDFSLHLTQLFTETNYRMKSMDSLHALQAFAEEMLFPSHALIVRPHPMEPDLPIFKGIVDTTELETAFLEAQRLSPNNMAWVETDMRAHHNPTRMKNIGILAEALAMRLSQLCPRCDTPGWGKVDVIKGLLCRDCHTPTHRVKETVLGCTKCEYQETHAPQDTEAFAEPQFCDVCNP